MADKQIKQFNEETSVSDSDWFLMQKASTDETVKVSGLSITENTTPAKISNPHKFSVYRDSTQIVAASTFTKIQLSGEDFDTNNNFDSSTNYRYTAPVDGFYQFTGRVSNNGNGAFIASLFKNGAEFRDGNMFTVASGRSGSQVSDMVQLTAGDYIELYVYSDNTTIVAPAAYDRPRLSGYLVSRT